MTIWDDVGYFLVVQREAPLAAGGTARSQSTQVLVIAGCVTFQDVPSQDVPSTEVGRAKKTRPRKRPDRRWRSAGRRRRP